VLARQHWVFRQPFKLMHLLAFHQRRLNVSLKRSTRRLVGRSDQRLQPICIADHVRAKRLKENLTMKESGRNLGIAHASIKFWEMHKGSPSPKNSEVLVEYLGFDPD